ncbi:DNA-binding CsgD family transcriptional regulator [Kitasatospora sp. MAA4]|uniref:ATP-binding protein n=1 Tax=Kitasatospora sp. MAA4 TaxID=3035093 RepID=UPI0024738399|nr:AAA family ATPase [Kitasatospora sp. MAA4]MDH6137587.1 DNA-binding CsgD family transcriptional regulator [Kitasatospora sp. MAA4]
MSAETVGRSREAARLRDVLSQLPAVALVEGEAGVGKSQLVHEAAGAMRRQGTRVLTGCCHPLRESLPYGPVLEAVSAGTDGWSAPDRLPPQTGALARLLPGLADRLPPAPPEPADHRAARFQIVGAVRGILAALGPVVLVVEDVQWADPATRDLLFLLARDVPEHVGLLLTYRHQDLPAGTPVLGTPYRRPPGTAGVEIALEALTEPDVQGMSTALGSWAGPAVARTLFERSAGLPLVVQEDLATLADWSRQGRPGGDVVEALERARVPRALAEAVLGRLAGLSPAATALAHAAAVLRTAAGCGTLAQVAGVDAALAPAALAEGLRAAVLHEHVPGRYGLRHALARQAVYQDIPGPRRESLHRTARQVLGAQPAPPLVQVAYHAKALGDLADWLPEAEAAAAQAAARGDGGTAGPLLRAVLAEPQLDPGSRARCALALARLARDGDEVAPNTDELRRLLADPGLAVEVRGEIRLALGLVLVDQADRSGSPELRQAVRELAGRPELAVRAMAGLARSEPRLYRTWLQHAERTVAALSCPVAHAAVRGTRLGLMARDGDPAVWTLVDRLPRSDADREVLREYARAIHDVGVAAMEHGHDERAADLLTECQNLGGRSRAADLELRGRTGLLVLDWLAGRWTGLADRVTALAADAGGTPRVDRAAAVVRGNLAAVRGQWNRALAEFGRAAALEEPPAEAGEVLGAIAGIAHVRLAQGDPHGAWAALADVLPSTPRPWVGGLLPVAVRAALACGHQEAARQLVTHAEHPTAGHDSPAAAAAFALSHGLLLADAGAAAAAGEQFQRAQLIYQAAGRPYQAAQADEYLAHTRLPAEPHAATQQLARIADVYTRLGATADASRCQRTLRDLGLTLPRPRGRRGCDRQLSPRQLQVALLLADGASNLDIAQALCVSPRTAEHHVADTLKKLGVPRRALCDTGVTAALGAP